MARDAIICPSTRLPSAGRHPSLKLYPCGYARPASRDQTQTSCLVRRQPSNNLGHLLISVDSESLVLGHTRQLHILAIQLLLHDLLERLERKYLGFRQGKRLVKFVLEFGLRALGSGANGFGVVAVECARGLGVVAVTTISFFLVDSTVGVEVCLSRRGKCCVRDIQTRPVLIISRNQKRHTKRP